MSSLEASYWHALNIINSGNLWKFTAISGQLGGPEKVFNATEDTLINSGINPQAAARIIKGRDQLDPQIELGKITRHGIQLLTQSDPNFPALLKNIPDSPPLIYTRGDAKTLNQELIAFVGSRKLSSYGSNVIKRLVPPLCNLQVGIASGLAYGADAVSLESCLDAGGTPVAVLASSLLDSEISPKVNYRLAKRIESAGCLVSENPPGAFVGKVHFPLRNRIVSGLSLGVVVIEAGLKSGSLVTAAIALDQNKEVFAVPGPITSANSEGTNDLLKRGAICTTTSQDIAQTFGWDLQQKSLPIKFTNPHHKIIYESIVEGCNTFNGLVNQIHLSPNQILVALTELELLGSLHRAGNGVYHKGR